MLNKQQMVNEMAQLKVDRFDVTVEAGKSISLHCPRDNKTKTYKMGDMAEYDSYNFSYYGPIIGITEKRVRIVCWQDAAKYKADPKSVTVKSLSLSKFCWRAIRFDYASAIERNRDVSYYI